MSLFLKMKIIENVEPFWTFMHQLWCINVQGTSLVVSLNIGQWTSCTTLYVVSAYLLFDDMTVCKSGFNCQTSCIRAQSSSLLKYLNYMIQYKINQSINQSICFIWMGQTGSCITKQLCRKTTRGSPPWAQVTQFYSNAQMYESLGISQKVC